MAQITLTAGTLAPPACYSNDQQRLEAYVAAIVAAVSGGVQWEANQTSPADLTIYWLQLDSNNRPIHLRKYSTADASWVPVLDVPFYSAVVGGTGDAITLANSPVFVSTSAFITGRKFVFASPGDNSGAVTLAIDGLTAKPVVKGAGTALDAGDILSGQIVEVTYNLASDWFEMQTPPKAFTLTRAGVDSIMSSSSPQAMPLAGSNVSIAHNQSAAPKIVTVRAKKTIAAEQGYAVGDEVDLGQFITFTGSGVTWPGLGFSVDGSSIIVNRYTGNGTLYVFNKTSPTTTPSAITTANWSIVAYWL